MLAASGHVSEAGLSRVNIYSKMELIAASPKMPWPLPPEPLALAASRAKEALQVPRPHPCTVLPLSDSSG